MKPDKPTAKERIEHILNAIGTIQKFTKKQSLKTFLADDKTIYACLYQYAIIGEATSHINNDILEKYKYPWHKVKSFRNFIIHEYHAIEMSVIWNTTNEILPDLKKMMQKILMNEFK